MNSSVKQVELPDPLRGADHAVFGLVCALVIGIFAWSAESGFFELASPLAENSYYNLLVKGFRAGQLNVKREAPPGLTRLADPYDPAINASYVWDPDHPAYEMSYYKGKLYLYFGVTPALVLFWPYVALTGHYLLHKNAVVIFFALGFLVAAGLLRAVWRRYFPEAGIWAAAAGMLALGLATGILENLSSCDVYEVAKSCGFAFTMLALAAIWCALHESKRQVVWLLLASLAYGLAIGSRPSLLFGAIILLMPVAQAWRAATEPGSRRRAGWLLAAAVGPAMLIGLGLMLYNLLRFDNPFEFGWHYQLTSSRQNTAQQFSLHYLWFNFRFYFLEPMRWGGHFPYLQTVLRPPLPPGYWGVGAPYCGMLINHPLVWLALAAPLAWRGRPGEEISVLRWFAAVVFLLFMICALTLCLFFSASSCYELDFLPALMLLAVMGILGLEHALAGSPVWRRIARWSWCLLLAYSVAFNILASVETHATASCIVGNSLLHQGRVDEAVERFQKALALEPESASSRVGLGIACCKTGRVDEAIILFQKALEIEPNIAEAQYDLGCSLLQTGRGDEAIIHFQKAMEIEPDFPETRDSAENNNMAWSLATNPEARKRNGALAVKLAGAACQRTHYQQTIMVGTLAAAYAEAGRFDEAILTAQRACELAGKNGETNLLQKNGELLALYQNHQPYRTHQANTRE
jgi:tetratricopeptide (TPR) repeat protein